MKEAWLEYVELLDKYTVRLPFSGRLALDIMEVFNGAGLYCTTIPMGDYIHHKYQQPCAEVRLYEAPKRDVPDPFGFIPVKGGLGVYTVFNCMLGSFIIHESREGWFFDHFASKVWWFIPHHEGPRIDIVRPGHIASLHPEWRGVFDRITDIIADPLSLPVAGEVFDPQQLPPFEYIERLMGVLRADFASTPLVLLSALRRHYGGVLIYNWSELLTSANVYALDPRFTKLCAASISLHQLLSMYKWRAL